MLAFRVVMANVITIHISLGVDLELREFLNVLVD